MHLIPATDIVESVIKEIRNGDIIELSGSLVNVQSDSDGWHWKSSQTRNDTGKRRLRINLGRSAANSNALTPLDWLSRWV